MSTNQDHQETTVTKHPEITLEALKVTARQEVGQYLASIPGEDSLANNSIHRIMRDIMADKPKLTERQVKRATRAARYRLGLIDTATYYLPFTGIPFPNGQTCREFEDRHTASWLTSQYGEPRTNAIWDAIFDAEIFRGPLPNQDREYIVKPVVYLKAAFLLSDMSDEEILATLEKMKEIKNGRGILSNL